MPRRTKTKTIEPMPEETTQPAPRPKKKPSVYCEFVRDNYHSADILKLPVRDRLKELGRRWQAMKQ